MLLNQKDAWYMWRKRKQPVSILIEKLHNCDLSLHIYKISNTNKVVNHLKLLQLSRQTPCGWISTSHGWPAGVCKKWNIVSDWLSGSKQYSRSSYFWTTLEKVRHKLKFPMITVVPREIQLCYLDTKYWTKHSFWMATITLQSRIEVAHR